MTQMLLIAASLILGVSLACLIASWYRLPVWARAGSYFLDLGFLLLCVVLFLEAIDVGVFLPVANRHQAMVFFAWSILLMFLFVRRRASRGSFGLVLIPLVMALLIASAVNYRAEISIPREFLSDQIFAVHTISAFLAYAAFALSFVTSVLYLLQHRSLKSKHGGNFYRRLPNLEELEHIAYFMILLGVPLITVTLITGFVWSKGRFGHYWLWEPKVILATLTWFVYTLLLFVRFVYSMRGKKMMTYLLISFSCVLVTFLGNGVMHQQVHSVY